MTSYNPINGTHAAESKKLITDILKEGWGFDGIVMSDWRSTYTTIGCVESGLDLEMPSGFFLNYEAISELIDRGVISEKSIDQKCRNILRTFIRFGFLDKKEGGKNLPLDNQECCDIAYAAALEGPVMLKNDGVLPLGKKDRNIVIIGPNADFTPFGGGSGAVTAIDGRTTTVYSAMKSLGGKRNVTLLQADSDGNYDANAIKNADAVILCVGFHKNTEKEGADRTFCLPEGQDKLIEIAASLNDKVIVSVNSGGEVDVPWLNDVEALIMDWYSGQEGGRALASILYGITSPSGRLPFTFWGSEDKNPSFEYYGTKYNPVPPAWRDSLAHTLYHEVFNSMIEMVASHYKEGFGLHPKAEELPDSMDALIADAMQRLAFTMHDDIVKKTRRILAMEQFRSARIAELTTRYHLENLQQLYTGMFAALMDKGILKKDDPEYVALEFVSPVSLLIHMYDRQPEREKEVIEKIQKHFEHFANVYACDTRGRG